MDKKSWVCTVITQLSLCFALFVALNIGRPQKPKYQDPIGRGRPLDVYFITVNGGSRPPKEQIHLLKQMEKAVKMYKARFVINISELGEGDPLIQNAMWYSLAFEVPWYTTKAWKAHGADYFLKQVIMPYGKTLDVIVMDTSFLQDPFSGGRNDQLTWLMRTLEASNANWRIVAGFHGLVACGQNIEQMETKVLEPLHGIFLKYGVNAYLSGQPCFTSSREEDIIGNITSPAAEGPYLTTINPKVAFNKEKVDGFLLHRVSSLEIVTYFVALTGEIVHKISLQQGGKDVM